MLVFVEGLKLNCGCGIWTPVAASVGKTRFNPAATVPVTLNPRCIVTTSLPVVTVTSRAPSVASDAMVIGTESDVALAAVTAPIVMPFVPDSPGGNANATVDDALVKCVFAPVTANDRLVAPIVPDCGLTFVSATLPPP